MLESKTIKSTSTEQKTLALKLKLSELENDFNEFREQLSEKGLRFILNEIEKVNMDIIFMQCVALNTENMSNFFKFFA